MPISSSDSEGTSERPRRRPAARSASSSATSRRPAARSRRSGADDLDEAGTAAAAVEDDFGSGVDGEENPNRSAGSRRRSIAATGDGGAEAASEPVRRRRGRTVAKADIEAVEADRPGLPDADVQESGSSIRRSTSASDGTSAERRDTSSHSVRRGDREIRGRRESQTERESSRLDRKIADVEPQTGMRYFSTDELDFGDDDTDGGREERPRSSGVSRESAGSDGGRAVQARGRSRFGSGSAGRDARPARAAVQAEGGSYPEEFDGPDNGASYSDEGWDREVDGPFESEGADAQSEGPRQSDLGDGDRRPRRRRRRRRRGTEPVSGEGAPRPAGRGDMRHPIGGRGRSEGAPRGGDSGRNDGRGRRGGDNRSDGGRGRRGDSRPGRRDPVRGGRDSGPRRSRTIQPSGEVIEGTFEGVLELHPRGYGFLRDPKRNYAAEDSNPFVSSSLVEKYQLRQGVLIRGDVGQGSRNQGPRLRDVELIDGFTPEEYTSVKHFDTLTAINPFEQIKLEIGPRPLTMRVMDLLCPIGKGQRALLVAPPRTGKTMLLQDMANSVSINHPEIHLMVLLIDERPEEVTEMRRNVKGEVISSSLDSDVESHIRLSELIIERAKRLAEEGKDVFILLDSITRLARAFNKASSSGRTATGGLDIRALDVPKKLFGQARRFDEGGSLTVCGTALIDTGSRMDEAIFQEFKGTGNMEMVLSRELADRRIWPSIDITKSGTRREEKILAPELLEGITMLRRSLISLNPVEAMEQLTKTMEKFPTNLEFLSRIKAVL